MCADDCTTHGFLDWLEAPFTPREVAEAERLEQRRLELLSGEIPA